MHQGVPAWNGGGHSARSPTTRVWMEETVPLRDRWSRLLDLSAGVSSDLDLHSVAARVAETVVDITDFQAASVTVREGDRCRRLAAAGLDEPRVGLETAFADWEPMLQERFRVGKMSYLLTTDAIEAGDWAQSPSPHELGGDDAPPGSWTDRHGMVLALRDRRGEIAGFLSVDAPRSGRLPDGEIVETLELVAYQARAVLINSRLYHIAERQRRAAETLHEVIEAVSSSLDLQEVLLRCCDAARHHSVGTRATVFLHDPETSSFRPMMSRGQADAVQSAAFQELGDIPEAQLPILRGALDADEPAFIEDIDADRLTDAERRLYQQFGVRSVAAYPLVANDRKVGVLTIDAADGPVVFPADERALMGQIARHAAMAIRQARLHEAAREHASRSTGLYELTKAMTETFDFSVIFARLSRAVRARLHVQTVSVFEISDDHFELLRGDFGDLPSGQLELPFQFVPLRGTLADLVDRTREDESLIIDDASSWPDLKAVSLPGTRSMLIAGHVREDDLRIALVATSTEAGAFDRNDAVYLRGLVQVAALALRNARLYEETREAAERDSLTGLKNRRLFWSELGWQLSSASEQRPLALAVMDVDDYKQVNDTHGHAVGDRVLRHVADRLSRSVRQTDTAYRIGGDEFALIMPRTDRERALTVIRRATFAVKRSRLDLPLPSLSAGVAVAPFDAQDGDALFSAADAAMYISKRGGKATSR